MAIRQIRLKGDEILTKKTKEIEVIDEKIKELAKDMIDTLYANDGIGLAASQVGMLKSMIVYDIEYIEDEGKKNPVVCINPKVLSTSKSMIDVEEGCLSFPNIYENVQRYEKVTFEYTNLDGKRIVKSVKDMEAVVVQHETDHLLGIVFLDRSIKDRKGKSKK
ncbi:MAG: peptide deformylase [Clostridia bacterium]